MKTISGRLLGKHMMNLSAGLLALLSVASNASENTVQSSRDALYFTSPPTADEIAAHIFPRKTRSIVRKEPPQKSVGMPILFHFGKTTIVESSRPFLNKVGEMMQQPEYSTRTLIIEGHTDAVGTDGNNLRLSDLRALSIKRYLVSNFGIDPLRLFPQGKGETMLRKPDQPTHQDNRRVEFLAYKAY